MKCYLCKEDKAYVTRVYMPPKTRREKENFRNVCNRCYKKFMEDKGYNYIVPEDDEAPGGLWIRAQRIGGLEVEYLRTAKEKSEGLQFKDVLQPNTILVFEDIPGGSSFHSQNCKFPFTIAFLNRHNKILKALDIYPTRDVAVAPPGTVRAIEANVDFFLKRNLKKGNTFNFEEE